MIVLDTNVVSELMRPQPDTHVVEWVTSQPGDQLYTSSITLTEILFGIARLPDGHRKRRFRSRWDEILASLGDRVLGFDSDAARAYADIAASREAAGRPIGIPDAQIAAVCRHHEASLATRNGDVFVDLGLVILNPFDPED